MNLKMIVLVVAVVALVLAALPAQAQPPPFDGDPATVHRIDVDDPIAGGVAVSQLRFPDGGATGAVIATDADFADALAGASLTSVGPLLLTPPDGLAAEVGAELQRAVEEGSRVFLLGGVDALSAAVADDLSELGFGVDRVAGLTRFETAEAIVDRTASLGTLDGLLLARGFGPEDNPTAAWADSISGSVVPDRPILLTQTGTLHPAARRVIESRPDLSVAVLGGTAAVSQAVQETVPAPVERVAGDTRDGTAAAIAYRFLGVDEGTVPPQAILYDGWDTDGWKYGLTVASYGRQIGAPLLPVNASATAVETARQVACGGSSDLLVMGSTTVVTEAMVGGVTECPEAALVLDGDGILPVAPFGAGQTPDEVVAALEAEIGAPLEDTGWIEGCPLDGGEANERYVSFNGLSVAFYDDGAGPYFRFWSYGNNDALGLRTARGIGPPSTNAELAGAYPGATFEDSTFGPMWTIPESEDGPMLAFPPDGSDNSPVDVLYGGNVLFCE